MLSNIVSSGVAQARTGQYDSKSTAYETAVTGGFVGHTTPEPQNQKKKGQGIGGVLNGLSNLFSSANTSAQGLQRSVNGFQLPPIRTENAIDNNSMMMLGGVALVLLLVFKGK